jgi:hypothetical protein
MNNATMKFEEFKRRVQKTIDHFKENTSMADINYMIYGPPKAGKTSLLATARRPIYLYEFDKGGANVDYPEFIKGLEEGWIIVDDRFSREDPFKPTDWVGFTKDLTEKVKAGFFEFVGTIAIDSVTSLNKMALNYTLKLAGRVGSHAFQQDYAPAMALVYNSITLVLSMPCDSIFIMHDEMKKDDLTGAIFIHPMVIGKHAAQLPVLFDEIYVLYPENYESAKRQTRRVLFTQPNLKYKICGSRIGGSTFNTTEEPDLRALRLKAKAPMKDKKY